MNPDVTTILLVEDSPDCANFLRVSVEVTSPRFELIHVERLSEALQRLNEDNFDAVLLDLNLPDSQGVETFLKMHTHAPQVPIIVLTGLKDDALAVKVVREGAQDYLIKGQVDGNLLTRTIRYAIERKRAEGALWRRVAIDKIRASVYEMRDNIDLQRILISFHEALRDIGLNFEGCSIQIVDEEKETFGILWWALYQGQYKYHLLNSERENVIEGVLLKNSAVYDAWRNQRPIYRRDLDKEDPYNERMVIRESYSKEIRSILDVPFFYGTMAINSLQPNAFSEQDIETLEMFAPVLSEGYTRYIDIIERHRAEEELKEAHKYTRNLIDSSLDMLISVDKNRKIVEFNQAAQKTFGYSAEEVLGKSVNILYNDPKERLQVHETIEKTGQFVGEITNKRKNGGTFPAFLSASILRNTENEFVGIMGTSRDITERKHAEEALRESMKREAQAYAQGRLEVINTILHNIGNAINNVTIGISTIEETLAKSKLTRYLISLANAVKEHQDSFADYIQNDPQGQKVAPFIIALADDFMTQDEELAKIVDRVRKRAEHIADIIRTERALGKKSGYRNNINVRKAIDDAIIVLQDSIGKRNIEIIVDCDTDPKEISTQESQFHQMLVNLLKNSIEAIDERVEADHHVRSEGLSEASFIKIGCYFSKASSLGSNSFILEVTDNGIGMEKDKLNVIFRPGYTTKKSGSGRGLHSIANFVKDCGGQIFALSDGIGKGTTIRVALPISTVT